MMHLHTECLLRRVERMLQKRRRGGSGAKVELGVAQQLSGHMFSIPYLWSRT
jgi:hypothetical protein